MEKTTLEARLAETLAVLGDLAEGGDAAAALYLRLDAERGAMDALKSDLMEALHRAETGDDRGCLECGTYTRGVHLRHTEAPCLIERLLLTLGGAEEAARQLDAAEDDARREASERARVAAANAAVGGFAVSTSVFTLSTVAFVPFSTTAVLP